MAQQVQSSATAPEAPTTTPETAKASSWSIGRIVVIAAAVLGGIIVLLFVVGLLFALFSDVDATASRIQIIRDIFIIMMALEFIFIIAALAVLILQVARLVNLLQTEVKPVLENTQEAVNNAKGTVDFVGKNVAQPVVKTSAFLAGAGVFIREVGGLRRAIRPSQKIKEIEGDK